jgi:hypothetical protein
MISAPLQQGDTTKPDGAMNNSKVLTPDDELERWRKKKNAG